MMNTGQILIAFREDESGQLNASIAFLADGATENVYLGGPFPVGDGAGLVVGPSCVQCELQTSVWPQQIETAKKPAPTGKPTGKPEPTGNAPKPEHRKPG